MNLSDYYPITARNKIINGNFSINQRLYVSGTATTTANQYTLDRWRVVVSGQNITFSTSGNGNIVTSPTGGIEQVIEGANIKGGTYTLSWGGSATAEVNGTTLANGGQVTLPASTDATIKFYNGTVSLVQLEEGAVATPFENRLVGTELALCQRYFISTRLSSQNSIFLVTGIAESTATIVFGGIQFPVVMRTSPTTTVFSAAVDTAGRVTLWNDTGTPVGSGFTINNSRPQGIHSRVDGSTSLTPGEHYSFSYTANAEF